MLSLHFRRFRAGPDSNPVHFSHLFLFFLTFLLANPAAIKCQCPTIAAILVDACGTEQNNEFIIIHSGGGFLVNDLQVDYDINNNGFSPLNSDININATPCGLQAGNPLMITGCTNVIPVGPGTFIPANGYVLLQTSISADVAYDFSSVCGAQQCVYLIQSTCARTIGAFTNFGASALRTTILNLTTGCTNSYTYDRALLVGGNGAYFIPPATYGNGGCAAPPVSFGNPPVTPSISGIPATICQTAAPIALPTTQSGITGNWSGTGVSANNFNPAGLSGNITLTFTPTAGQCANIATTSITVNVPVTPTITGIPASICETASSIALPTTQSGITGNWSGTGVTANNFNPAGLSGNITLTFTPDAGQCANATTTSITVNTPVTPAISGIPASLCESDASIPLPTSQSGITGNWSGTGVSGNIFNPAGLSGNIILTFTPDAGQCANTATTSITVNPVVTPTISGIPANICENAAPISLPTNQSGITGNWSGSGVSANNFNPSGLSGNIILTFTPNAGQCANTTTTSIFVNTPVTPTISGIPASLCQNAAPIPLPTNQSGIIGNWSGNGVLANNFNPSGLNGNITLTFTPNAGQCANIATTMITVNTPVTPNITGVPASMCESDASIALPTNQSGINGNWSGSGVTANNFNPAGLSGNITLTFTPNAGQCANIATAIITINTPVVPTISGVPSDLCEGEAPVILPTTQSGITGNWSGQGVATNIFDPSGLSGNVSLLFTPDAGQCAIPVSTSIMVNTAPSFTNLMEDCDLVTQTYTVSFDISGGNPLTYTVNGLPVGGSGYISAPIPSGTGYVFNLDDGNSCGPVVVSGSVNCSCATSAGTMDFTNTPLHICDSSGFTVIANGDHLLDGDDVLEFILHTNPGAQLGFVLAISPSPTFNYPGNIVLGQTYYASAVAGSNNGSGGVNLSDPCLSVSQGIPVIFYVPTVTISSGGMICENDCFDFQVQFTGYPPFNLNYSINTGINVFTGLLSGNNNVVTLNICPSNYGVNNGQIQIYPTNMTDINCSVDYTVPVIQTIMLLPVAVNEIALTLCPGQSIVVNGTLYNQSNPVGTELLQNAGINGCDSMVNVNLSFYPPIVFNLNQTLCTGGSLTVNGTVYNQANPMGTEILQNAGIHGCDSIVNVSLSFNSVVTFNLNSTLCTGESIVVNGATFDEINPSGSVTFFGGSYLGCDSVVNISLSFYTPAVYNLIHALCNGGSITVNGTIYNQANPNGTELLQNASSHGCDSIINVSLSFNSVVTFSLNSTLCPGGSIVVNGATFDETNPSGSVTFFGGSYLGCDSVVNITLSFYAPAVYNLIQALCNGGSITVNGTIYNQANPNGTELLQNASSHGCDSVINVSLSFNSSVTFNLNQTLCPGGNILVNGITYNEANPTGSETFTGGSHLGCDSIVNINLSFYPPAVHSIDSMLQPGQSLLVNGTLYSETNPTGIEVIPGGSYTGCDSTIMINLHFGILFMPDISIVSPLCKGGSDGSILLEGINGGVLPFMITLDGLNTSLVNTFPFMFTGLDAGTHVLIILDAAGIMVTRDVLIPDPPDLLVDLGSDRTVLFGQSILLTSQANFPVIQWSWTPSTYLDCTDCAQPTVMQPMDDITYTLVATDVNGCSAQDEISIFITTVHKVFVPTIFSPNGDGFNDVLVLHGDLQIIQINNFVIFNRWGNMVHNATNFLPNDVTKGWDGMFNSKKMDPGVYAWMAEVEFRDGKTELFKGDMTLVR